MIPLQKNLTLLVFVICFGLASLPSVYAQGFEGYYRYPDIHGDRIVFTAEGDLWTVSVSGGILVKRFSTSSKKSFLSERNLERRY